MEVSESSLGVLLREELLEVREIWGEDPREQPPPFLARPSGWSWWPTWCREMDLMWSVVFPVAWYTWCHDLGCHRV